MGAHLSTICELRSSTSTVDDNTDGIASEKRIAIL
jgi:hypothetical protein